MRYTLCDSHQPTWEKNAMLPKLPALLAVAGFLCILLSTVFGVSHSSEWLLDAAQGFFLLGIVVFAAYIFSGIVRDARAI
jgi:hypothetical protein